MEVEVEIVEAVNPVFEAAEEAVVVVVIIGMIEKAVNPMFEVVDLGKKIKKIFAILF